MKWIKISERLPEKTGKYFTRYKNYNGEQRSASFFDGWKFPHHVTEVEWLDESPVDRGVEKAAEELTVSIQELAEQHCRDKDYSERQFEIGEESFIAGVKWAGNDADYWKQRCEGMKERCEAAEKVISCIPDRKENLYELGFHQALKIWQTLKQKQL